MLYIERYIPLNWGILEATIIPRTHICCFQFRSILMLGWFIRHRQCMQVKHSSIITPNIKYFSILNSWMFWWMPAFDHHSPNVIRAMCVLCWPNGGGRGRYNSKIVMVNAKQNAKAWTSYKHCRWRWKRLSETETFFKVCYSYITCLEILTDFRRPKIASEKFDGFAICFTRVQSLQYFVPVKPLLPHLIQISLHLFPKTKF